MSLDHKQKSAGWKYTALSSSDASPEIAASSTCEKSPLLLNMENEDVGAVKADSDSAPKVSLVNIHRKTKRAAVDRHSRQGVDEKAENERKLCSNETTESSTVVQKDTRDVSKVNWDQNGGAKPKTNREMVADGPSHNNGKDDAPAKSLDIVRKMSEMSLVGGKAWQVIGQYGKLKTKRCQRVYALSGRSDDLALFHINGKFFAMEAWCTHMGGPLFEGDIENYRGSCHVMCPWHSYMFDLETGKNEIGLEQKVYEMKYENGYVYVWYHSAVSIEPVRKISVEATKHEPVTRKTSVLESPLKL